MQRNDILSGKSKPGELRFAVRVTPRGGRDAIDGWAKDAAGNEHLKVRLRAAAEGGKANAALVDLVAKSLAVPRSAVAISSGAKARLKIIRVAGDPKLLTEQLELIGGVH
jgi:hypothetical protein